MQQYVLGFLVSGVFAFGANIQDVSTALNCVFWSYVIYTLTIIMVIALAIWLIPRISISALRTAVITLFFVALIVSPVIYFQLEAAIRPNRLSFISISINPMALWLVVGLSVLCSIGGLVKRLIPQKVGHSSPIE